MWRERGRLPHAIDITASIVEVVLHDHGPTNIQIQLKYSLRSEHELRLQYSIVIVRAVNGLVDPSQQSYFADSVLSLASRIDIPGIRTRFFIYEWWMNSCITFFRTAWIVELRHDATHNNLPPLSVLRSASRHMLTWLQKNYWMQQIVHLQSLSGA